MIRYGKDGYALLKVARDPDRTRMRRLLETAAAGLPTTARMVVDAGYGWRSSDEALDELPDWGDTPLAWLEDPLVPEDADGCAAIRREGGHPVGVGDEVTHIATFRALLDAQALDVLRLDVPALGGITPARHVQALAAERGVPVSLHIYPEVSVHLAPLQTGTIVETFDRELPGGNPLRPSAHAVQRRPGVPRRDGGRSRRLRGSASSSTGSASGGERSGAAAAIRVAAQVIRRRWPETGVLVLSQYVDAAYALRLLDGEQSRCGYLLRTDPRRAATGLGRPARG